MRRSLVVVGNLAVSVVGASALRGAEFSVTASGVAWFAPAAAGFAVAMYGAAEVLALLRFGLVDPSGRGLHDIWACRTRPRWPGRASPSWRPSPWS